MKEHNNRPRSDEHQGPDKVFTSQSVWGNDELIETLDASARAHRVLRKRHAPSRSIATSTVPDKSIAEDLLKKDDTSDS